MTAAPQQIYTPGSVEAAAARASEVAVRHRELILLCRQLGAMLSAGTDILRALLIVRDQVSNPMLQSALETARNDMALGCTLAVSLGRNPALFSPFFVDMVRQGEGEGMLGEVLCNLADYLEKELRVELEMGAAPGTAASVQRLAVSAPGDFSALFRLAIWVGVGVALASALWRSPGAAIVGLAAAAWGIIELIQRVRRVQPGTSSAPVPASSPATPASSPPPGFRGENFSAIPAATPALRPPSLVGSSSAQAGFSPSQTGFPSQTGSPSRAGSSPSQAGSSSAAEGAQWRPSSEERTAGSPERDLASNGAERPRSGYTAPPGPPPPVPGDRRQMPL